jgi:hypothetical protein
VPWRFALEIYQHLTECWFRVWFCARKAGPAHRRPQEPAGDDSSRVGRHVVAALVSRWALSSGIPWRSRLAVVRFCDSEMARIATRWRHRVSVIFSRWPVHLFHPVRARHGYLPHSGGRRQSGASGELEGLASDRRLWSFHEPRSERYPARFARHGKSRYLRANR